MAAPRVAFFADSFHEVNGVALTSRQLDAFARRRGLPFFSVHIGPRTALVEDGSHTTFELARGPLSFAVERDMSFDLLFMRYARRMARALRAFRPDVIHITGPSDVGILGAWAADHLRVPLVASWHTNLHEFGAARLARMLRFLPDAPRQSIARVTEKGILNACARFYRLGRVLLAPNPELMEMLHERTRRPVFLMQRGSDTVLFDPARRDRTDSDFVLGFVGRVTPEKSVRLLVDIERALIAGGHGAYRFVIVGDGSERAWLEANLRRAEFPGVLKGEELARAYANMDLFVFPSRTDTFGNVILEAHASGVPAVVTGDGGPKYLVESGVNGVVAGDDDAFVRAVLEIVGDPVLHRRMCDAAREHALTRSWDRVFEEVYEVYGRAGALTRS